MQTTLNNLEYNPDSNINSGQVTSKSSPFILFEVNVRDNVNERLEIYDSSTAFKVCDDFCLRHKLPHEKKEFLYKLINEKLQESS